MCIASEFEVVAIHRNWTLIEPFRSQLGSWPVVEERSDHITERLRTLPGSVTLHRRDANWGYRFARPLGNGSEPAGFKEDVTRAAEAVA
jgi:hypothetical protein